MFVQQVNGRNPALSVSYERGRAMPQYCGATSKIILACLPQAQLRHLWAAECETPVAAGLPDEYAQLVKVLAGIRKTGYFIAEGEVALNAVGFAVPLKDSEHLLGSLGTVMPAATITDAPTSQNHTRAPARRRRPHRRSAPGPASESARQQKGRHCMNASSYSSAGRISLN